MEGSTRRGYNDSLWLQAVQGFILWNLCNDIESDCLQKHLEYKEQSTFVSGILEVDQTLPVSAQSLGFSKFTSDTYMLDPNMCCNHVTAIPAANH